MLANERMWREFGGNRGAYQAERREYIYKNGLLRDAPCRSDYAPYAVSVPWNEETTAEIAIWLLKQQVRLTMSSSEHIETDYFAG